MEDGTVSAGHVTVLPGAARFTLYQRVLFEGDLSGEERMMHVQYDVTWAELDAFRAGPECLCELVLETLAKKLNGEEVDDPCGG